MKRSLREILSITLLASLLSGCSTIKMPNLDFIKLPEFIKEAENIDGYPKTSEAQALPTSLRSDAAWDKAAKKIMLQRDTFTVPSNGETPKTDAETVQEMRDLTAEIDEYKIDDPQ